MMKKCKYCENQIHENASFCPYCMKSQIEKCSIILKKKKSSKPMMWVLISFTAMLLIAFVVIVCIIMSGKNYSSKDKPNLSAENSEIITTTVTSITETTYSTTSVTSNNTTISTTSETTAIIQTETTTATEPDESTTGADVYYVGNYITEGKSISQIQGYGGYEDVGGTILEIEEISENAITFSIIKYSESGYASDTVSARNITAEIIDNKADFKFTDMLDGHGTGAMTFENGKIYIKTWSDDNSTSIIVDEYLIFNDIV